MTMEPKGEDISLCIHQTVGCLNSGKWQDGELPKDWNCVPSWWGWWCYASIHPGDPNFCEDDRWIESIGYTFIVEDWASMAPVEDCKQHRVRKYWLMSVKEFKAQNNLLQSFQISQASLTYQQQLNKKPKRLDQLGHDATGSLETHGQRSHVQQQQVLLKSIETPAKAQGEAQCMGSKWGGVSKTMCFWMFLVHI